MSNDKEKAEEILKARDDARKGIEHDNPKRRDPLKAEKKKQEKIGDVGLALGVGLGRDG